MKLMACSSALIIALLSISSVPAADSVYLEERMKRLDEKANTSTVVPKTMQQKMGTRTRGARAEPVSIMSPEPWWH